MSSSELILSTSKLQRISGALSTGKFKFPEGDAQQREFVMRVLGISKQLGQGNPCTAELVVLERDLLGLGSEFTKLQTSKIR